MEIDKQRVASGLAVNAVLVSSDRLPILVNQRFGEGETEPTAVDLDGYSVSVVAPPLAEYDERVWTCRFWVKLDF